MTIDRYFELQDKLLCLENALQHYGMRDEAKTAISTWEELFDIVDKEDIKHVEQRCLDFLSKYKHVRDKFNIECV